MKENILIIEDEDKIARLLEMELTYAGYNAERAATGIEGLEKAFSSHWSIILLDIMLPELNGLEVLHRMRQKDSSTPVILLTARNATAEKVNGLDQGANDYITKPFEMEELLARIRACIRHSKRDMTISAIFTDHVPVLQSRDLIVNPITREVTRSHMKIDCTPKEFELLVYLLNNRNQVMTREQIIRHVWGNDFAGDSNIVDVYIRYLRKKIDHPFTEKLIQTKRGVGYGIMESG
ncbi:response regulator transcription factor [Paenibacillus filicis]|uniref:Response regulator transcription factor n=1 Tax=Paenibacillus gyeongsangnamensis TaxID=3388067 RepID=A0ABT4QFZ7_9BACL|nr:response regulator transcription factor [Paenibacillus filicis]MCZ8515780.1 response regulator transcription factor [Paenibacillus filicis]